MNTTARKTIAVLAIIAAAASTSACSRKPTLDRSVLEGYNKCIEAYQERLGKEYAVNKTVNQYASPPHDWSESECKRKYGLDNEISEYRIIN